MPEKKNHRPNKSLSVSLVTLLTRYTQHPNVPQLVRNFAIAFRQGVKGPGRPKGSGLIEEDEARLDRMEFLCRTEKISFTAAADRVAEEEDIHPDHRETFTKRLRRKWRIRHPDWKSRKHFGH